MGISFDYPIVLILFPFLVLLLLYAAPKNKGGKRYWLLLALRLLIGASLLLNLAGRRGNLVIKDGTDVLFTMDVSASIPSKEKARASEYIRKWGGRIDAQDRAGVIVFAKEALIERPFGPELPLPDFRSNPDPSETDIAGALQLSKLLISGKKQPRIVLLSDGRSTTGGTIPAALDAARAGIRINVFPLGVGAEGETYISSLQIPENVRTEEPFTIRLSLKSRSGTRAKVHWSVQGELRKEAELFVPGEEGMVFAIQEKLEKAQPYKYQIRIFPEKDTWMENNQISGTLKVSSRPEILYVYPRHETPTLAQFLPSQPYHITYRSLDETISDLRDYDLIILDKIPAWEIKSPFRERLRESVIQDGTGLLVAGDLESFSLGQSLKAPLDDILPVTVGLPEKKRKASLALVILLDKSGSMEGEKKILYAKKAASSAVQLLDDSDYIGLIAFDVEALPIFSPVKKSELSDLDQKLEHLQPSGGTDLMPALMLARDWMQKIIAQQKLVLILSDGRFRKKDPELLTAPLVFDARISTVGIEPDADRDFLTALAEKNGGYSYFGRAGEEIPRFFVQEIVRLSRQAVLSRAITPKIIERHPILNGIDQEDIPAVSGYVATGLKKNSTLLMDINDGDPFLAIWQVGLGRSAVFTTDLMRWGPDWLRWEGFPQLLTQLMRWLVKKGEYFEKTTADREPFTVKEEIPSEFRNFGADLSVLKQIADLTGGKILGEEDNPLDYKTGKDLQLLDLSPSLLLLAMILFLVELLLRKILG